MAKKTSTCIYCGQIIPTDEIKKYGVKFCSEDCLKKYEAEAENISQNLHLDDCC
ncbi:TPA: hypothetical protein DF272_03740 [Candidatus Falkowbacteria bacterium]|nr:hypothetical protein [Candidatus Falkowbacteria bacterium]